VVLAVSGGTVAIDGGTRALGPAEAAWIDTAEPFEIDAAEAWLALELDTP
jgi:mannose-6-phosphate isomerase